METIKKIFKNPTYLFSQEKNISSRRKLYNSLWAVFFGLVISGMIILILGSNPFWVFSNFISGAFLDLNIKAFWINFSIFVISGIAVGIGFKVGLFNIGVAGQMMFGGMLAIYFIISQKFSTDAWIYLVSILIAILAAVSLALIAALLKAFLNIHEVVTTILLNWVVVYIGSYLYNNDSPHKHPQDSGSLILNNNEGFFSISVFWIVGILFVLFLSISMWIVLQKTTLGYKIKMTGLNKDASKYAGVNDKITTLSTLAFSGALAGLAGWIFYVILNQSYETISSPLAIGFDGIAISLLAYNNPIGILFSSFLYSIFQTGSSIVAGRTMLSKDAVSIIPSVILYLAALSTLFMNFKLMSWIRKKLFLVSQKIYWEALKKHYQFKMKIFKEYNSQKNQHKKLLQKNKNQINTIKKTLKNQLDFKTLEKMSNEEKLNYYEQIQKEKSAHLKDLKNLGYFEIKNFKNNWKANKLNANKKFHKFADDLFVKNKGTSHEWLYYPVWKIKSSKMPKGGDK